MPEKAYFPRGVADQEAAGVAFMLGNGLEVVLVHDDGGLVHNVSPEELRQAHLSTNQAREIALGNLKALMSSGAIEAKVFDAGPEERPFILFSNHWLAASCILLPDLYELASKRLGTTDIRVSIPNRNSMLVFPKGDAHYRQAMRALVREKESDDPKLLTFKLFGLTKAGPVERDKE